MARGEFVGTRRLCRRLWRNIGFTTAFFARCIGPKGHVIGFEPLPSNAADARHNLQLNNLTNAEIRNQAVGSRNGTATLAAVPNGVLTTERIGNVIDVPLIRLDDAITNGQPTVLKIDVEGYELDVLEGASRILAGQPKLDIEVHPVFRPDPVDHCRKIFNKLRGHEYELFVQRWIDGPIEAFNYAEEAVNVLAAQPVFHVFGRKAQG